MVENIQVTGYAIKCTERDILLGLMGESMKEIILMIKNKEMEYLLGLIVVNIMVNGLMENKRE
jgi:hypothetical protein